MPLTLYPSPTVQLVTGNPLAPAYMQGIEGNLGGAYRTDPLIIPVDVVLTASAVNVQQQVTIDADADFMLYGISIPTATGLFSFQLNDSRLYYMSNNPVYSTIYSTDPLNPTPVLGNYDTGLKTGGLWFAAGSRLGLTMNELSVATNTIQMLLHGAKLFRNAF